MAKDGCLTVNLVRHSRGINGRNRYRPRHKRPRPGRPEHEIVCGVYRICKTGLKNLNALLISVRIEYLIVLYRDCGESVLDRPRLGCAGSRSIEYDRSSDRNRIRDIKLALFSRDRVVFSGPLERPLSSSAMNNCTSKVARAAPAALRFASRDQYVRVIAGLSRAARHR